MPIGDKKYDVVVVGAGVFGAWTAHFLRRAGRDVALIDGYGAGNARAASAGETRVLRLGYGADEIYSRMAWRSRAAWEELSAGADEPLFLRTGVLWLASSGEEDYARATAETLGRLGAPCDELGADDLRRAYPQMDLTDRRWGLLEREAGILMARRALRRLVSSIEGAGVDYGVGAVAAPAIDGALEALRLTDGRVVRAESFVFACGAWLATLFPDLLGSRIRASRQEVFFFGPPAGDDRFSPPALPVWIDLGELVYGIPDVEHGGLKVALHQDGPPFDPDRDEHMVSPEAVATMRIIVGQRFPDLAGAPLLHSQVCHYENTANGEFLIDVHPAASNVWLVGGGSGHGFKHGPAVGEYVAERLVTGGNGEPRFSIAAKGTIPDRTVI